MIKLYYFYNSNVKNNTINKAKLMYQIVKIFYLCYSKKINLSFLLNSKKLISMYTAKESFIVSPLNNLLKRWFYTKIYMNLINILINYARKVRIFNKSRYSRNRQNVRATFYFSIYFNIIIIYAVFSVFYNIALFLTYNWWLYFIFCSSFFVSYFFRVFKK